MPTLNWLDSFQHQNLGTASYGVNAGLYDTQLNTAKMTYVPGRRSGGFALQIVQDATTAARMGKTIVAGNRTVVESFYFRVIAAPSVASTIWHGVATVNATFAMATDGSLTYTAGSGATKAITGNYADSTWHRVDLKWVTSATTYTLDIQIDSVTAANGQHVSGTTTAADITETRIGSPTAAHTLTCQFADWARSVTAGDYPIGAHQCRALIPNADGTHSWASTNMGPSTGGVASSVSTLWQSVDDWATVPVDITDYIQYANTTATSTEFAEITLPDVDTSLTVWAARGVAAILAGGTAANSATTRIVDGSNVTVVDVYAGDQSDSAARVQASMMATITTPTALNALKYRVGFPTDSNPAPWWAALMIDYAIAGDPVSGVPVRAGRKISDNMQDWDSWSVNGWL